MKIRKIMIRILIVFLILISLFAIVLYRASAQVRKERKEVTELAEEYAHLVTTDDFYWYNGKNTYYTVEGKNNKNQTLLVTVPQKEGKIIIQNQKNGITADEARDKVKKEFHPYKITKVEFGYVKNEPIWEVTTQNSDKMLSYYDLSFKDGRVTKKVENF